MSTPQVESVKLDELNCWRISHGGAELLVAQQGAQILSYQREGEQPLIWLNDQAVFKHGTPVRAGVPVCWPWFGVFARNPEPVQAMLASPAEAGSHGLVRAMDWQLQAIDSSTDDNLRIDFTLPEAEGKLPGWPHKVALKLSIILGDHLSVSLTTTNLGDDDVALSQALHSYFAVSDVRDVHVEGVAGLKYIETLDDWKVVEQANELRFAGETDRIYKGVPAQLTIVDPVWKRRVRLTSSGANAAVIWNPWIDRAAQLSDMADDGWQRMLCIETANVMDDIVVLLPGAEHTLGVTIVSEPL
ncbi:D-hexose-6-phosphate mutarotase [Pseudomonas sp. RIT-To-2]|uniref:D-hexose-6-phosphate mutarotase n=1 Tax=Pseudomonas sp. RIT-To-2 TaxID=3462541 RepID=UPI002413AB99